MSKAQKIVGVLLEDFQPYRPVKGGIGDKLQPEDVDQHELAMGIKIEMEHTKDRNVARDIALDHLKEDPKYYSKLSKAGL
jgi:hypothetical protein